MVEGKEDHLACWAMEVGNHRLVVFLLLKEGTVEGKEGHDLQELYSGNS